MKTFKEFCLLESKEVREFKTYQAWKKAVKELDKEVSFTGDKDIDSAFKKGEYDAEWDGEKGYIKCIKAINN